MKHNKMTKSTSDEVINGKHNKLHIVKHHIMSVYLWLIKNNEIEIELKIELETRDTTQKVVVS